MGLFVKRSLGVLAGASALIAMALPASAQVNVNIYNGHSTDGGGAPFSDLVGSFTAGQVDFATSTDYNWHPFDLPVFGAEITGCLSIADAGDYTFGLNSDDGSLFYLDNMLVVDNGGPHSPGTAIGSPISLSAGLHPFKIEFYEDFGGPSGVDLLIGKNGANPTLASSSYFAQCAAVPEPGTYALMASGLLPLVGVIRRRRRAA